ncbi:unnamed protein product [Alternaria alternata]
MTGRGGRGGGKVLLPPHQLHFQASTVTSDHLGMVGFDEFMNLVIDDAIEVTLAKKDAPEERRKVGQILLKGDNISLIQQLQ